MTGNRRIGQSSCLILLLLLAPPPGCTSGAPEQTGDTMQRAIEEIVELHSARLMRLPGVVGVGQAICDGQPCIRVFISKWTDTLIAAIPSEIEGYPVDVEATGPIEAY